MFRRGTNAPCAFHFLWISPVSGYLHTRGQALSAGDISSVSNAIVFSPMGGIYMLHKEAAYLFEMLIIKYA